MSRTLIALFVAFWFVTADAQEEPEWRPMWMAVTSSISIEVEELSRDARKAGLNTKMLHDAVSLGLRRNKIEVGADLWGPTLSVRAGIAEIGTCADETIYAYGVNLEFWTVGSVKVLPWHGGYLRSGHQSAPVDLWGKVFFGAGTASSILPAIREFLTREIDALSLDFLTAEEEAEDAWDAWQRKRSTIDE